MRSYEAEVTIAAAPDRVWEILTDAAGYPAWDSGVVSVEGAIRPEGRIKVVSEVSPGRAFPVKVTAFEAPRFMAWTGGMPLGLFRGVRTFRLEPVGAGTRFSMREEFTGLLTPLIWRSMPDLGPSFRRFAEGLKATAERIS